MKRKYPLSFFLLGVLQNLIKNMFILIVSILCFIAGHFLFRIFTPIAQVLLILYFVISIVEQYFIMKTALSHSENNEFNELMDDFFGVDTNRERNY